MVGPAPPVGGYDVGTHLQRGRTTVRANLKDPGHLAGVRALLAEADVFLEGYRPGTTERLGLGPEECLAVNPRLVYGRMTGWGQDGPLAQTAGHDINYIALTGALHAMGPADAPMPPMNLVGDFGGGSMFVLTGILAALWERERSGQGQVVDAAMVDGVSVLSQIILELRSVNLWSDTRAVEPAGRGRTRSTGHMPVPTAGTWPSAPSSRSFTRSCWPAWDLPAEDLPDREDPANWPALAQTPCRRPLPAGPGTNGRRSLTGVDACVTPVLTYAEAAEYATWLPGAPLSGAGKHVAAAPAPRFSRTRPRRPGPAGDSDFDSILSSWRAS